MSSFPSGAHETGEAVQQRIGRDHQGLKATPPAMRAWDSLTIERPGH